MKIILVPDRYAFYRKEIFNRLVEYYKLNNSKVCIAYDSRLNRQINIPIVPYSDANKTFREVFRLTDFSIFGATLYQYGLISLIIRKRPQLIIAWGDSYRISTWIVLLIAKFFRIKVILWTHGLYGVESFFLKNFRLCFYSLASCLFVYGNYGQELLNSSWLNVDTVFVGNSLSKYPQIFDEPVASSPCMSNEIKLLFIGRFTKKKRLLEFFNAIKDHKAFIKFNLKFTLIGSGPSLSPLKALASNNDYLSSIISFVPETYDDEILFQYFYSSHIYFQPTHLGLGGFSAFFHGLPVITCRDPNLQMPEFSFCNSINSELFEYCKPLSFLNSVEKVISNYQSIPHYRRSIFNQAMTECTPDSHFKRIAKVLMTI